MSLVINIEMNSEAFQFQECMVMWDLICFESKCVNVFAVPMWQSVILLQLTLERFGLICLYSFLQRHTANFSLLVLSLSF